MPHNTFSFNYDRSRSNFDDFFLNIGYDEFLATFSPYGNAGLKLMHDLKTGIKYIRIHNMFTDESGDLRGGIDAGGSVVSRNDSGHLVFDFSRIDKVYDSIIQQGFIPYVEFGFMPRALASKTKNKKNMWKSPPKNFSEWRHLIQKTVSHLKSRYPEDISKFVWELWNEPNFPPIYFNGTVRDYCKLYDYTVAGMTDVLSESNFKIGGPALVQNMYPFLFRFIRHCTHGKNYVTGKKGTKLNFISFHLKGGMLYTQTPNVRKIQRMLLFHHKFIEILVSERFEIHITELDPVVGCDKGISDAKKLNWRNTNYYAAFIGYLASKIYFLKDKHKINLPIVFSDNFHLADDAKQIFGGCRHLTTASFPTENWKSNLELSKVITKPVVKAYQILNKMKGRVLEYNDIPKISQKDITVLITEHPTKEMICVVISNFNPSLKDSNIKKVNISIQNLPDLWGKVSIVRYIVDSANNSTYKMWTDLGKPKKLTVEHYTKIKTQEKLIVSNQFVEYIIDRELDLTIECNPHSLIYLELFPL